MVESFYSLYLFLQLLLKILGQDGGPVFATLAATDKDEILAEINILNTQTDALHQSQTATVKQFGHESMFAGNCREQALHFISWMSTVGGR